MVESKIRVAVLGGGMGGLAAAYELSRPHRAGRYEVTVYSLGWRLGGKGASSRNPAAHHRIEEHGLHLWMGCYENAFRIMRDCYGSLARPAGTPLATWRDAFVPRDKTVLYEQGDDGWYPWPQRFPVLDSLPGESEGVAGPLEMIRGLVRWGLDALPGGQGDLRCTPSPRALSAAEAGPRPAPGGPLAGAARKVEAALADLWAAHEAKVLEGLFAALRRALDTLRWAARAWFRDKLDDDEDRRAFITLDYVLANVVGMLEDRLALAPDGRLATYGQWLDNLARIDDLDYRVWLRKHGAHPKTAASCIVRGLGDAVFNSGKDGAAGAALNGLVRLNLTYRGSVFWQMQAGMGETVFTPLYQALVARGVRFEPFCRVENLKLDSDRRRVVAVEIARQARVKGGAYDPLVAVPQGEGKVDCWPPEPDWDQLEGGARLRDAGVDLEGPDPVPGESKEVLEGFDRVVLAVPVGALRPITTELAKARPRWRAMLDKLTCTATQSAQLWFDTDLEGLGWTEGVATATAYVDPLDTWAEMTHLLEAEGWGGAAKQLSYLVGSLEAPAGEDVTAQVTAAATAWIEAHLPRLLPTLRRPDGRFDTARIVDQYIRANTRPSDLYTLTEPGTTRHRLRPHRSGFDNLTLAGDWTKTGLNVGSIEAATMSGLRAAKAICGDDVLIVGDYED